MVNSVDYILDGTVHRNILVDRLAESQNVMWTGGNCLSSIIFCLGLRPGDVTPASPHSVEPTRETAVTGYKSQCSIGVECGAWAASDGGKDPRILLDNYCPPVAEQPPVNKGSWNVLMMTPGLSKDLQGISDARKTAVISSELLRLQVDIAALQETRLADSGTLQKKEFTFFWHGKSAEDRSEHEVGFAVRNTLLSMVELGDKGSERLMTLRLHTSEGPVTLVSAYAPTLTSRAEANDEFYINISNIVKNIPPKEHVIILGDFNDRTKPQHRVSWCHPRSKHWHQLDMILIRRSNIKLVQITRTYHSADCDTDHSLVCCKIRLQLKKLHKSKQKGKPRINTTGMHLPEKVEEFAKTLQKALSVEHQHCSAAEKWNHLRDTIQKTALATFGKKASKNNNWFDAKFSEMSPVIDAKRAALAEYKRSPNEKTLEALRAVRSKVQQTARRCASEYWQQLSDSIQFASVLGNIRRMYEGIKTALGPTQSKTTPLKTTSGEVITGKGKQMDRWVEHYSELYSRENTIAPSALDAIEPLPIMEELDAEPTIAELGKAIDSLASGKAPGNDGIPLISSNAVKTPYCSHSMTSYASVGKRKPCRKT
ncbi:uncharacterized protein LOC143021955 [Oratosquilla oratoria]|uniref:uncharacterized protein LOC143021955 n=1 Tax=Oratosquilla oratoria TaxID=337810 RepID=UPI003F7737B0